jgi:hypothetical protein
MSGSRKVQDLGERRALFLQFLQCLDREENLIHYRLTWGLQWNVACSAAIIILLASSTLPQQTKAIVDAAVAVFGAAASVASLVGVLAAHKQTSFLIASLVQRLGVGYGDYEWADTEFIRPYDDSTVHKTARRVSALLPVLFLGLWLLVFLHAFPEAVQHGR